MKFLKIFENFEENIITVRNLVKQLKEESQEKFVSHIVTDLNKYGYECEVSRNENFSCYIHVGSVILLLNEFGITYNNTTKLPKDKFDPFKNFQTVEELHKDILKNRSELYFNPKLKGLSKTGIFEQ